MLCVTFYKTLFDPRRDMILEEEFEYAITSELDEDKLAHRLQRYLQISASMISDSLAMKLFIPYMY